MMIMDATLLIVVLGALLLALGVELAALFGWLRAARTKPVRRKNGT